jgi:hypothetical protein
MAKGFQEFLGGAIQGFGQTFFPQLEQMRAQHLQKQEQAQQQSLLNQALTQAQKVYADPNLSPEQKQIGLFQALSNRPEIAKALGEQLINQQKAMRPKAPPGGLSGQSVPQDVSNAIQNVISSNPESTADQLALEMDKAGIPRTYSNSYIENRRRQQETGAKTREERRKALRQETLPIRTDLAKKAQYAEQGIQNKEHLIEIIERGDIDDPTYAILAEYFPLNLGKRLLSNDTVVYKSGLVDEFGDLRNIFKGQTRVKEIDVLEKKIADLYLTDDQKKAILKSRINSLKADIIRAEAAAELEDREDLGVLQFNKEVEKIAKPRLDALFGQILDEQKSIIDNAEKRKKVPLNLNDPEDLKIIDAILLEANKNPQKAKEIAKKKGYSW